MSALPDEKAVQTWIAERLRLGQGRSFYVDREVHVADEKEPDIRLRAGSSGATVPIEIKIAESWSVKQLEAALIDQLCGQYLRERDGRHGILLLVHKTARQRGWTAADSGKVLSFDELAEHLRSLAAKVASAASDASQPEIAVINVSGCAQKGKGSRT